MEHIEFTKALIRETPGLGPVMVMVFFALACSTAYHSAGPSESFTSLFLLALGSALIGLLGVLVLLGAAFIGAPTLWVLAGLLLLLLVGALGHHRKKNPHYHIYQRRRKR